MATSKKKGKRTGATAIYLNFISERLSPRKKEMLIEKKPKKQNNWGAGEQGAQEKARRVRQMARGIIR